MPIRVGIIGLSSNPATWATTAHVGYLKSSPLYDLVALSSSTPETAAAAAKVYGLPAEKGYSTIEGLVHDPEVDLVVVSVKVLSLSRRNDHRVSYASQVTDHMAATIPAIEAGKDVFVEWPLATSLVDAEELTKLAKAKGVNTVVGLQTRHMDWVLKVSDFRMVWPPLTGDTGESPHRFRSSRTNYVDHHARICRGVYDEIACAGHLLGRCQEWYVDKLSFLSSHQVLR
jgi:predicted dehydrogenase